MVQRYTGVRPYQLTFYMEAPRHESAPVNAEICRHTDHFVTDGIKVIWEEDSTGSLIPKTLRFVLDPALWTDRYTFAKGLRGVEGDPKIEFAESAARR
jgi:hypothetical protein